MITCKKAQEIDS